MVDFNDISIIGGDDKKTELIHHKMYKIYLILSNVPPTEWVKFFIESRKLPRNTIWRKAYTSNSYIIIECPLEELKDQLVHLNYDVEISNKNYKEFLKTSKDKEEKKKLSEEKINNEIKKTFNDLFKR